MTASSAPVTRRALAETPAPTAHPGRSQCANNTSDISCRVPILVISPGTKAGARAGTLFNHYSLLGTAEQLLRLSKLGQAASYPTMVSAFNL